MSDLLSQADKNRRIARSLRESKSTFIKHETHELPAMTSFIRRHILELEKAIAALEEQ